MPDRDTIVRIAKILARAGSDNPNEAAAALSAAYKRMARDGVTLNDLLSLPTEALYQETLVRLVDMILADQSQLSHATKREAYAQYMLLIATRFSAPGQATGAESEGHQQERSREEAAQEYERRRRQHEEARGRTEQGRTSQSAGEHESPNSQQNSNTVKQQRGFAFNIGRLKFSFSPARFFLAMQPMLGRGSIFWHTFHDPSRALRLFAASLLWGMAFAAVFLVLAGFVHALLGAGPLWDMKLRTAFSALAAIGTLWKGRVLFLAGWFHGYR